MRLTILLSLLFVLVPAMDAADTRPPSVAISKVDKQKKGKFTVLDFFIRASDNEDVTSLFYRGAVDGKQGPWRRFPYYDFAGYVNHIPITVDCDRFTFEVKSVDRARNESVVRKKTFTNLR